jgi:hypothetical protein
MSADKTTHEWHLTPKGWVEGTFSIYDVAQAPGIVEPPSDRVETWVRNMTQSSSFSKEYVTWECVWHSPNYSREEREKLGKKYPRPAH